MAPKRKPKTPLTRPNKVPRNSEAPGVAEPFEEIIEVIDSNGDLLIKFVKQEGEDKPRSLLVSRHVLCLSSKVFRTMLDPDSPFMEGSRQSAEDHSERATPHITLGEDNCNSMTVIMNVIHLKGSEVPTYMSISKLMDLARLCDKYDFRSSLGPWPEIWSKSIIEYWKEPGWEYLFFIATTFRLQDILPKFLQHLTTHCTISEKTQSLVGPRGHHFDEGIPESLLGRRRICRP